MADDRLLPLIALHRQRALQHRQAGELAEAVVEWHLVTLLAPDDPSARQALIAARAAVATAATAHLQAGHAALRAGDTERATAAFLQALAVDPDNAEAAATLREIDRRKFSRIQTERAARVRMEESTAGARSARAPTSPATESANAFALEQGLELFNAGDLAGGLRELHAYVDAHPHERAVRQRIGNAVFDRGRALETQGAREQALSLYDAAVALRGEPAAGWPARTQALRRTLSGEYYDRGVRMLRADLAGAIRAWEQSLRYDPGNSKAATRLAEARIAQARLRALEKSGAIR